jgi:hypothetical protein
VVVAVICTREPEKLGDPWPNGVYTCTPVLTAGKWRWLLEMDKDGIRVRRTVVDLWPS